MFLCDGGEEGMGDIEEWELKTCGGRKEATDGK